MQVMKAKLCPESQRGAILRGARKAQIRVELSNGMFVTRHVERQGNRFVGPNPDPARAEKLQEAMKLVESARLALERAREYQDKLEASASLDMEAIEAAARKARYAEEGFGDARDDLFRVYSEYPEYVEFEFI